MSRYTIPNNFIVGYDNPLETFFAQQYDTDEEVVWETNSFEKLTTLDQLKTELSAKGVTLPPEIERLLVTDQMLAPGPTELQRRMRAIFEKNDYDPPR